jgi:hypothetical protein
MHAALIIRWTCRNCIAPPVASKAADYHHESMSMDASDKYVIRDMRHIHAR